MTEQDKELQELRRELTQAQSANVWLKYVVQKLERENDELKMEIEKLREETAMCTLREMQHIDEMHADAEKRGLCVE